jgi:hypothetical protein
VNTIFELRPPALYYCTVVPNFDFTVPTHVPTVHNTEPRVFRVLLHRVIRKKFTSKMEHDLDRELTDKGLRGTVLSIRGFLRMIFIHTQSIFCTCRSLSLLTKISFYNRDIHVPTRIQYTPNSDLYVMTRR